MQQEGLEDKLDVEEDEEELDIEGDREEEMGGAEDAAANLMLLQAGINQSKWSAHQRMYVT